VQRAGFLAVPLRRAELEAAYSYNEYDRLLLGSQSINKQRWKSPNNSVGGGLSYLGDDIALYRRWYEIKGKDDTVAWRKLIHVTKVLTETPAEQLEQALALIAEDVARDTRNVSAPDAFLPGILGAADGGPAAATTIKGLAELRRAALLAHPEIVKARGR
jgi:hypothetical protein